MRSWSIAVAAVGVGVAAVSALPRGAAGEPAALSAAETDLTVTGFSLARAAHAWTPGQGLAYPSAPPGIRQVQQNIDGRLITLPRAKIPRGIVNRNVHLTGPWLDYAVAVMGVPGVSASIRSKKTLVGQGELVVTLRGTADATRGLKTLRISFACPVIPMDCNAGPINFPVMVLGTGPIASISPNGVVAPGQVMTFTLTGRDIGVARPVITGQTMVARSGTSIRVQTRTPSCGAVIIPLYDQASGDWYEHDEGYALASGYVHAHVGVACPPHNPQYLHGGIIRCPPHCESSIDRTRR